MSVDQVIQIIQLIIALISLGGAAVGAFFAIRNWIKVLKTKNSQEIWSAIQTMADAAMKEAEASGKTGADKKQMVIDAVKAACKSQGLELDSFLDQLGSYIDQTITFVNSMKTK